MPPEVSEIVPRWCPVPLRASSQVCQRSVGHSLQRQFALGVLVSVTIVRLVVTKNLIISIATLVAIFAISACSMSILSTDLLSS